jgi:succinate dehydrogenase flavin-adding protein (antitoxin of CptAB toxin-antitoxin module)
LRKWVLLLVVGLMTLVSACGGSEEQTMSTDNGDQGSEAEDEGTKKDQNKSEIKAKEDLTEADKIALDFLNGFMSQEKEKRLEAVEKYISGETKDLFKLAASGNASHEWSNIKVIESIQEEKDGKSFTLVLLHATDENENLHERVAAVMDKKVLFVYSSDSGSEEIVQQYNDLRSNFDTPIPAQIKEQQEKEANSEAKVEVTQQNTLVWKDSVGEVWVHFAGEIKNTGNAPASIGSVQINFKGQDGSVLGTESMITPTPDIVMPGQTAYISASTILDTVDDPKQFKESTVNIDFDKTSQEPLILTTDKVKTTEGKKEYDAPYTVTGTIKNPLDKKAENIEVAASLYNDKGEIIAVLSGSLDVSLNPNSTAGFELQYPPLPQSIKGKIKETKVKTYSFQF